MVKKFMPPLFIVFVIISSFALLFGNWLDAKKIDHFVIIGANLLLLLLTIGCLFLYARASVNPNPNVFVRSVMGITFMKLMVIVVVLAIYLVAAGKNRSVYAILVGMALYIIYTVIEVKAVLQLNKRKDGSN